METSLKNVLLDAFWIMPATPKYQNQGLPYITSKNIKNRRIDFNDVKYIDEADYDVISRNRPILENDILISMIGTLGEVAVVKKEDGRFYGQNMYLIRLDESKVSQKYFLNWVESDAVKRAILQQQNKSTQSYLKAEHVEGLSIKLQSVDEQNRIADIFERINQLTENRKQQLQKLDALVKARFVEMFGDVKTNDKKWSDGILSEYFLVKGGKRIPKGMGYSNHVTTHPYLRTTDMKNSTIIDDDIHYIDEEVFQKIKRYTVNAGDIYLTNVGVNLGMAGTIPERYDGANLTENAVKLIPKSNNFNGDFLAFYINSSGIQDYITERKMTVGVPKLAIFRIETMPLVIPPIEIQNKFADFVQQIDKSKLSVQKSLEKLETLKKALMQKYFG